MLSLSLEDWLSLMQQQVMLFFSHTILFVTLISVLYMLQRGVFALTSQIAGGRVIYLSAWIGAPVHELSHAICCLLFRHKIERIVLFNPDHRGTLGYVSHSYNNHNPWQVMGNFFIAIAPLLGGLFALYVMTVLLLVNAPALFHLLSISVFESRESLGVTQLVTFGEQFIKVIMQAYFISPVRLLLWAYCCAAISLHLSPSKEDLKGVWGGLLLFLMLCLLLMMIHQLMAWPLFFDVKAMLNVSSMLYVIGIILAGLLLLFLLLCRSVFFIFSHR